MMHMVLICGYCNLLKSSFAQCLMRKLQIICHVVDSVVSLKSFLVTWPVLRLIKQSACLVCKFSMFREQTSDYLLKDKLDKCMARTRMKMKISRLESNVSDYSISKINSI